MPIRSLLKNIESKFNEQLQSKMESLSSMKNEKE